MNIYTLQIAGEPVVSIDAADLAEATDYFYSHAFAKELAVHERILQPGAMLWNGSDDLFVRPSFEDEIALWRAAFGDTEELSTWDRETNALLVFLIPVRERTRLNAVVSDLRAYSLFGIGLDSTDHPGGPSSGEAALSRAANDANLARHARNHD